MRRTTRVLAASLLLAAVCPATAGPPVRRMSRAQLADKIRGGWAGQMIGVAFGAPTEFQSNGAINDVELTWTPERVAGAIHQDDLYVEMTFAEVMDRIGLEATTGQYGEMFRESKYRLWNANAGARRNLTRGVAAPLSGQPANNIHANDIDFQIEADFIGLMCPGLPQAANHYADRVGRVMNHGDGLYGGMFVAAMYAAAFFETDPRRVVEEGLEAIPRGSGYARVVRDVLAWHREHPTDWRKAWVLVEQRWNRDDPCPEGVGVPFNIDARLNGAYVVLGLVYGGGDFGRTLEISTRAGQDSDCNPSTAAGILGVMLGYERIPDRWKAGIPAVATTRFEFTPYSLDDIVASTLVRAGKVIAAAGGRVGSDEVVIPVQRPKAPPLEQWDPGVPVRVGFVDRAWSWKGSWSVETARNEWTSWKTKASTASGSEAALSFEGTGVAIVGTMGQDGGRAVVYLDGAKAGEIDAWIPERTVDNDYWHVTGLTNGPHAVRVVVTGTADPRSTGKQVSIEGAVVYSQRP
jgi:hypothetical protein